MATATGINQGKSAFLKDFLSGNRDANPEAVKQAWTVAGNEGTVSDSLIAKVRSKLGLTGKRGTTKEAAPSAKAKAKAKSVKKSAKAKKSRPVEVTPNPVGSEGGTRLGRSAFISELLGREPDANLKTVNLAWTSAGNAGSLSPSIYYKVKRELSGTAEPSSRSPVKSKPRSSSKGSKAKAARTTTNPLPVTNPTPTASKPVIESESGDRERVLDRVEDGIDDLIIELKQLGGMEDALESLRKVRRVVVRSHQG